MVDIDRGTGPDYEAYPRWINLVLGVWLFISAFVWPHTMSEQTNTWILGILIVIASVWAMFAPSVRYLNTLFAIWLFISTLVMRHETAGTLWNNLIVAVVVFVVSLAPSIASASSGRRAQHA